MLIDTVLIFIDTKIISEPNESLNMKKFIKDLFLQKEITDFKSTIKQNLTNLKSVSIKHLNMKYGPE